MKLKLLICTLFLSLSTLAQAFTLKIGTKNFTEGYLIGELIAQKLEDYGPITAERKFGLGGTGIVFEALKK
jgi:osmoprotectant transport system permease protein